MPIPLPIFGCYTIYLRNTSGIIKAVPVWMPFADKASMGVVWSPHGFVGFIGHSRICYLDHWSLVPTISLPSQRSRRILGAAGGSSQTSKIQSIRRGGIRVPFLRIVNDLGCMLRTSNIYTPVYYWSVGRHLDLLDD